MKIEKLVVYDYHEDPTEDKRMTLCPHSIRALAADPEDCIVQNRSLRKVIVIFEEGDGIELCVNHQDLELLEKAVGSFVLPEECDL